MEGKFKAIAAMAQNRVIGSGNRIPWHLPEDFRWFRKMTMGQILVMGRKTFESIGRPLDGRTTIVISLSGFSHPGVRSIRSLDEIDPQREGREVFICGGARLYAEAFPLCSDLYLTRVKRVVDGDTFLPVFEDQFVFAWRIMEQPEFDIEHYVRCRRDGRADSPTVSSGEGGRL